MKKLTENGEQLVAEIASEYNMKPETIRELLFAVKSGNGTMAQFNIAELGGQGQWMKGGMTMVGDLFNHSLKAKVADICARLAHKIEKEGVFVEERDPSGTADAHSFTQWPAIFGQPSATGSQNNFRYAYFPAVKRLVIDHEGKRSIYDTLHHLISGVSQQQGGTSSFLLTSQAGPVNIADLPVVSEPDKQPTPEPLYDVTHSKAPESKKVEEDQIYEKIERLKALFDNDLITDEEFKEKKRELLARL